MAEFDFAGFVRGFAKSRYETLDTEEKNAAEAARQANLERIRQNNEGARDARKELHELKMEGVKAQYARESDARKATSDRELKQLEGTQALEKERVGGTYDIRKEHVRGLWDVEAKKASGEDLVERAKIQKDIAELRAENLLEQQRMKDDTSIEVALIGAESQTTAADTAAQAKTTAAETHGRATQEVARIRATGADNALAIAKGKHIAELYETLSLMNPKADPNALMDAAREQAEKTFAGSGSGEKPKPVIEKPSADSKTGVPFLDYLSTLPEKEALDTARRFNAGEKIRTPLATYRRNPKNAKK